MCHEKVVTFNEFFKMHFVCCFLRVDPGGGARGVAHRLAFFFEIAELRPFASMLDSRAVVVAAAA